MIRAAIRYVRNVKSDKKINKYIFVVSLFFLWVLFFAGLIRDYSGNQTNVFFRNGSNYLADYINVAKYSANRDPYFDTTNGIHEHGYLPLAYVLFWILSKLSNFKDVGAFEAGYASLSLAEINLFFIFMTVGFFIVLRYTMKSYELIDDLLIMSLFASGIFMFSYERGNIIFLSAICVSIYLNYYESENRIKKHIAFVALAVAAGLKGFPAILGILLLYKKRWKDAIWLMLYGLLACLGPFALLVNGFKNIPQWIINASLCNKVYKYISFQRFGYLAFLSSMPERYLGYRDLIDIILRIILCVFCVIMIIVNCDQVKQWKKNLALVLILILFPVNSGFYCGLYMFPIIIMFFKEKEYDRYDFVYVYLFILLCNPFQIIFKGYNITCYLSNISLMIMFGILFVENLFIFCRSLKGKLEI